jgi:hypothetical protein
MVADSSKKQGSFNLGKHQCIYIYTYQPVVWPSGVLRNALFVVLVGLHVFLCTSVLSKLAFDASFFHISSSAALACAWPQALPPPHATVRIDMFPQDVLA